MQILKEHSPQSTPGDIKEQMPGVAWSGNREPGVAIGMVGCPLLFLPSIVTYDPPMEPSNLSPDYAKCRFRASLRCEGGGGIRPRDGEPIRARR